MVAATYPGTVSPLRGLDPFGEAERDVWQGREQERDELAKLVTADGFRAGLVFGEPGAGKTSLVRAGLIPHLRDHGIVALACEDGNAPAASFAAGLSAFGIQPQANEQPTAFVTRAVAAAVAGQQFVFVVDDVDAICADDRAASELSDLFARVVSRSAGRARFLFVCASERMHLLGALERRTGSLFPPSTRYELPRLSVAAATKILDRVLSLSGVAANPALAETVTQGISRGQPVLPADLQIAAMAMRDLKISDAAALQKLGGPNELEGAWLAEACRATGNERSAMRLCAELAASPGPRPADAVVRRINLDEKYASGAFVTLEQRGVIVRGDAGGTTWLLRHEVLYPRIRELTAPARAAARRAFDLLGSKTQSKERLRFGELRKLKSEGIAPVTPAEVDVVSRSKRYYVTIAGAVAAVPIVILILIWVSMKGHVYFDLEPRAGGERVVVRSGRAGLSSFFWLPGGFGTEVADTGLTRAMVAPEAWKKIDGHELGDSRGDWADQLPTLMAPQLAGLIDYATSGGDATLEALKKAAKDPEDLAELLAALRPIARGGIAEVALVEQVLNQSQSGGRTASPAVQRAAISVAGAAAQRRPDVYKDTLSKALVSTDPELRRIAFALVRGLGERGRTLFNEALALDPDADIKRELMVEASVTPAADAAPSSDGAIAVLNDTKSTPPMRDHAKAQISLALKRDPVATGTALAALIANERAQPEARVFACETLYELEPVPKVPTLVEAARAAYGSHSVAVRAAALPLYAKVDPVRAGGDLAELIDDKKLDKAMRVASALAWGEVASNSKDAASGAIDKLLKEEDTEVRAAAAQAAGKIGRTYQDKLVKMAKAESYPVRIGATFGLAASVESGGNPNVGIEGILQMWREKGRPRRDAVRAFAHLARKKPQFVQDLLYQAAHVIDDPGLHPLAVEGLCSAALAGNGDARRNLGRSTDDPTVEVRKLVMECVANGPDPAKNNGGIAQRLVKDPDGEIRADAARVLALSVVKGQKVGAGIADALVALLEDSDRDVRLIAIRSIATLGADAPKSASPAMSRLFDKADEGEKLALLRTAKQIGAAELVARAIADSSPLVRVDAVDAALASGLRASATLSAALADPDPQVRKAALEKLAAQKDKLAADVIERSLALAVRDPDPELSQLALTTIARVAPKETVVARLHRSLSSRAERERAQAAAAAIGLVDRDATLAVQLLEPLLDDPSHDVRVAMLPAIGASYAKTNTPEKLADLLDDSENNAMRRLTAAAAFVTLAHTEAGATAAQAALAKIITSGAPMARATAKLLKGLLDGKADGMAFLQELIP